MMEEIGRLAISTLEQEMIKTRESLLSETIEMVSRLKDFEKSVFSTLKDIESSADGAESSSNIIESTIDDIEETVKDIWSILSYSMYLLPRAGSQDKKKNDFDPALTKSFGPARFAHLSQ